MLISYHAGKESGAMAVSPFMQEASRKVAIAAAIVIGAVLLMEALATI
jgi:hypothetical protein